MIGPDRNYLEHEQRTIRRLKEWAQLHGVILEKIDEKISNTPDYKMTFPNKDRMEIIVEVREIQESIEYGVEGETSFVQKSVPSSPGQRYTLADPVRNKIRKAGPQLKPYSRHGLPTLLLIGVWNRVIDRILTLPVDILIAMRGGGPRIILEGADLMIESDAQGGAQASGDFNRSISAVGRLECVEEQRSSSTDISESIIVYRHDNPRIPFPDGLPGIRIAR